MKLVVVHQNVDLDAIVSAFVYTQTLTDKETHHIASEKNVVFKDEEGKELCQVITEAMLKSVNVEQFDSIVVLDMPLKPEIKELAEKHGLEIEHYDHHEGSATIATTSTARVLWVKFKDKLPAWIKYFVELSDYADTGQVLKQPAPLKYFHVTGYINALRTMGYNDIQIIDEVLNHLYTFIPMLQKLIEAEKLIEDIEIFSIGDKYTVAIVENKPHTVNQILFEHKNVDLIIFKDGNNLGITRNAVNTEPDLNKIKPAIEKMLREKGKPEEINEWFFHPAGFLVARGTRKHPARTPSVLTPYDLLVSLANTKF